MAKSISHSFRRRNVDFYQKVNAAHFNYIFEQFNWRVLKESEPLSVIRREYSGEMTKSCQTLNLHYHMFSFTSS